MPGKNILLFADGTGNSINTLLETNVWRMYQAADFGPPLRGRRPQVAYYSDGVGASAFAPLRIIQAVFGWGLKRNVLEIYSYACRTYDGGATTATGTASGEEGDRIYGFGFSRGAFTMRVVIDLIADQGLIRYTTERDLEWKAQAAYREFRRNSVPRYWGDLVRLWRWIRPRSLVQSRFGLRHRLYDSSSNYQPVIQFIGVWGTVAAYGGPIIAVTRAIDNWLYRLSLPHHRLHVNVRCARHALALDDARESFHPLLWDEVAEEALLGGERFPWLREGRIEQVWFAGMHADVGGGYPKDTLCHVPLLWMIDEAEKSGLLTLTSIIRSYRAQANSNGMIHDSRSGYGALYRYHPRRINAWLHPVDPRTLSFRDPATADAGGVQKGLIREAVVHESVLYRIFAGMDGYAPISLPREFRVTPPLKEGESRLYPDEEESGTWDLDRPFPLFDPELRHRLSSDLDTQTALERRMRGVWRWVRLRRVNYYLLAAAVIILASAPWWATYAPGSGPAAAAETGMFASVRRLLAGPFHALEAIVPSFVKPWASAWASIPLQSSVLVLTIIASGRLSHRLEKSIEDQARGAWLESVDLRRRSRETEADSTQSLQDRILDNYVFQRTLQIWKWSFVPNVVVVPIAVWLLYIAIAAVF